MTFRKYAPISGNGQIKETAFLLQIQGNLNKGGKYSCGHKALCIFNTFWPPCIWKQEVFLQNMYFQGDAALVQLDVKYGI